MGIWYLKHIKWCIGVFIFLMHPLYTESLRNTNKEYFNAIDWEELKDLAVSPLPEPFTLPESTPMPYADMITETGIYPVLPKLGILDYQNSPDDLLSFFDTLQGSFLKKSFQPDVFDPSKPFLFFLTQHLIKDMPEIARIFYARPSFRQDGSAATDFQLLFKNKSSDTHEQIDRTVSPESGFQSAIIAVEAAKTQDRWYLVSILIKERIYADSFNKN